MIDQSGMLAAETSTEVPVLPMALDYTTMRERFLARRPCGRRGAD